ncbi:MAG: ABC transporter permease [Candidatus Geothermincolia bacterium]
MRGWRTILWKDLLVLRRSKLLLAVLLLYPFLIMGVIGAAFSDAGRPVPVGVVNHDRVVEGEPNFFGGELEGGVSGILGKSETLPDAAEALRRLDEGEFDMLLAVERNGAVSWRGLRNDLSDLAWAFFNSVVNPERLDDQRAAEAWLEPGRALSVFNRAPGVYVGESIRLQDESTTSEELLAGAGGESLDIRNFERTAEAMDQLSRGRLDGLVILTPGFVMNLKVLDRVAEARVIMDQSNLIRASLGLAAVQGALFQVNQEVSERKVAAVSLGLQVLVDGGDFFGNEVVGLAGLVDDLAAARDAFTGDPALAGSLGAAADMARQLVEDVSDASRYLEGTALPINLEITGTSGRSLSLKESVIPALLALSILFTGVLASAILLVMETERGLDRRLRLTALGAGAMLTAKTVLALLIILFQALVMLLLSFAAFGSFVAGWPLTFLAIMLTALSTIGIGLLIAALAREAASATILGLLVCFPLIFICGAIFPLSQMPGAMQAVARAIPLTYAMEAMGGAMLGGEGLTQILPQLGALAAFAAGFLSLGTLAYNRRRSS